MNTLNHTAPYGHTSTTGGILESLSNIVGAWRQRMVARRELGQLDDRMLQDIGFSRCDAEQEMNKPFWRA